MIKQLLDKLKHEERRQLMYAFEHQVSQYIELPDGKYLGVNTQHIKHLQAEEVAGSWSYGIIKGANV